MLRNKNIDVTITMSDAVHQDLVMTPTNIRAQKTAMSDLAEGKNVISLEEFKEKYAL